MVSFVEAVHVQKRQQIPMEVGEPKVNKFWY